MQDVVLVADGGEITVGRRLAPFVFGEFNVILPAETKQEEKDDRLQDGYVCAPPGAVARFDVGFSRADATVDLDVNQSDTEAVIDAAQSVVSGDVFFERDIGPAGIGAYVPGLDFVVGDVVTVELWGRKLRLPVTSIAGVSSVSDGGEGVRVHVGGQLLSDSAELKRHTDSLRKQIVQDKRALERRMNRSIKPLERRMTSVESRLSPTDVVAKALRYAEQELSEAAKWTPAIERSVVDLKKELEADPSNVIARGTAQSLGLNMLSMRIHQAHQEAMEGLDEQQRTLRSQQTQLRSAVAAASDAAEQAQQAQSFAESRQMRFGSGGNSGEYASPSGNPFVEVTTFRNGASVRYNSTRARLKSPCMGYIILLQTTTDGLVDMNAWNVYGGAGKTFEVLGGLNQIVRKWVIMYQLY